MNTLEITQLNIRRESSIAGIFTNKKFCARISKKALFYAFSGSGFAFT